MKEERFNFVIFSICCNTKDIVKILFFSILIMDIFYWPELYKLNQLADKRECSLPWPEVFHHRGSVAILQRTHFLICYGKDESFFTWNSLDFRALIKHILDVSPLCGIIWGKLNAWFLANMPHLKILIICVTNRQVCGSIATKVLQRHYNKFNGSFWSPNNLYQLI